MHSAETKELVQSLNVKFDSNETPDISILSTQIVAAELTAEDYLHFTKVVMTGSLID